MFYDLEHLERRGENQKIKKIELGCKTVVALSTCILRSIYKVSRDSIRN